MTKGLPRWFRALFTVVMLALCCMVVVQLIHQRNMQLQIADLQNKIEASEKRLLKQQAEYAEYVEELPHVKADLALAAPLAEEAAAKVDELKEQRKALRAENEALTASVGDLQQQYDEENAVYNADTPAIVQSLEQVIQLLTTTQETLDY